MRSVTIEQILKVITVTAQNFNKGDRIDYSYQDAVTRVSKEYGVAYQTIGDACRRRLDLHDIAEFKTKLKAALEGETSDLRSLLHSKTPPSYHQKIDAALSSLGNGKTTLKPLSPESFVTYTIQLKKSDSDVLRALAELLGDKPEKILGEVVAGAIKDRMKKAVNQL